MLVYTAVARLSGTVRVKCLDQEHNTMSWPGIEPRLLVYTAVARLKGTVRVKCLDQEHNTMSWSGIEPRLLDLPDKCTREEAIAPPATDNVKDSKIHNYNKVIQYTWNNAPML